ATGRELVLEPGGDFAGVVQQPGLLRPSPELGHRREYPGGADPGGQHPDRVADRQAVGGEQLRLTASTPPGRLGQDGGQWITHGVSSHTAWSPSRQASCTWVSPPPVG